jgi:hypothetical protein
LKPTHKIQPKKTKTKWVALACSTGQNKKNAKTQSAWVAAAREKRKRRGLNKRQTSTK